MPDRQADTDPINKLHVTLMLSKPGNPAEELESALQELRKATPIKKNKLTLLSIQMCCHFMSEKV